MANFHPTLDLLSEYASGTLPLAQAACVYIHVNNCEHCKQAVAQLNELGSALFDSLDPVPVGDSQLNAVLARLDEEAPLNYAKPSHPVGNTPAIIQRLMKGDFSDLTWKNVGKTLRISHLQTGDPDHEFALYHIKAGGRIPAHTHRGSEMTLVLEGGFSDAQGNYHAGDFLWRDDSDNHAPTALQSEDCICLAVLSAPLKFTDWRFRWMNPFLRLSAG